MPSFPKNNKNINNHKYILCKFFKFKYIFLKKNHNNLKYLLIYKELIKFVKDRL